MIQENVSLKPFNTFGVEASARYVSEVNSIEELIETLRQAQCDTLKFSNSQTCHPELVEGLSLKLRIQFLCSVFSIQNSFF